MDEQQEGRRKAKVRIGVWIRFVLLKIKRHWIGAIIGALVTAIILGGQAVHGGKLLWEVFFPKPDALSLAQEAWKDTISRDFVEAAYRRLFWSRSFLARVRRHAPSPEINEAWKKLFQSIEYMNAKLLVYAAAFEQLYDSARRMEFERGIQIDFLKVTETIVDLRYSDVVKKLEFPHQFSSGLTDVEARDLRIAIDTINEKLKRLELRLYRFSNCFKSLDGCRNTSAEISDSKL